MKNSIHTLFFISLVTAILVSCEKEKPVPPDNQEILLQKEQTIISAIENYVPVQVINMLESHFELMEVEEEYSAYLDELNVVVDSFITTVEQNLTSEAYQELVSNTLNSLNSNYKSTAFDEMGLGYAKGVEIDLGISGTVGAGIVAGLQASGGGGVKTVYDFVNLDRQVYYTIFCSRGFTIGAGASAALSANAGFSGINEIITGIPYYYGTLFPDKFEGSSSAQNHSLGVSLEAVFGFDVSVAIGSSQEAFTDFEGIINMYACPDIIIPIKNGKRSYTFAVNGSISSGAAAEILLAYSNEKIVSHSIAASNTYKYFSEDRALAGFRMAAEILRENPMPGIGSNLVGADYIASTLAIVYGCKDLTSYPAKSPSIGTLPVENISINSCTSGGVITSDGGSFVNARGVCWNTSGSPTIADYHTSDGTGDGNYTSSLTGLSSNTKYFVRAYATNASGTSYGQELEFTTSGGNPGSDYIASYSTNTLSIDGEIGASEWNGSNSYNITLGRKDGFDTRNGTLYLQHDNTWLYLAVITNINSGWDVYLALRFDGNNDNVLNGQASEPHTDINIETGAPGAWSGYERYDYLDETVHPTTAPSGTLKASSGSTEVQYEFKIKLSDLNLNAERTVGFYMFNYNHGVVDESYQFPAGSDATDAGSYVDILIE